MFPLIALAASIAVADPGPADPEAGISRVWSVYWTVASGDTTADVYRFSASLSAGGDAQVFGAHNLGTSCFPGSDAVSAGGIDIVRSWMTCDAETTVASFYDPLAPGGVRQTSPLVWRIAGKGSATTFDVTFGPGSAPQHAPRAFAGLCPGGGPGVRAIVGSSAQEATGTMFDVAIGAHYYSFMDQGPRACAL